MKKKIILGLAATGTALALLPLLAAFEAHVINVTATIENALSVNTEPIRYGTVFPQEKLDKFLDVALSQSFRDEGRVDDVNYFIRQKPKCGITSRDGQVLDEASTRSGEPKLDPSDQPFIDCGQPPRQLTTGETWGPLPLLCPYLSKHPDLTPPNDGSLDAFHQIGQWVGRRWTWNDVKGHLAKSEQDIDDRWKIDLKVPCFEGYCAQDWDDFVHSVNATATPSDYVQPIDNEHKVFGCDLWIEVFGVSLPGIGCNDKADVMLVLDRSGSIDSGELTTLMNAAKAFVDALSPSAAGVHMGQSSFSTSGSLDTHLTDDVTTTIKANIDALVSGGSTNLGAGIDLAKTELDNPGDGHDRTDADSPDFMVVITDGAPNVGSPDGETAGKNAADAAKAAGVEIFVVGVGTTTSTADYLKNNIASTPTSTHYFDAADFSALEAILQEIASCNP